MLCRHILFQVAAGLKALPAPGGPAPAGDTSQLASDSASTVTHLAKVCHPCPVSAPLRPVSFGTHTVLEAGQMPHQEAPISAVKPCPPRSVMPQEGKPVYLT